MSLDVYLTLEQPSKPHNQFEPPSIYVRENGCTRKLTRAEWNERYPDREPVMANAEINDREVYWANITHNLGKMAHQAKLYHYLWRPDEVNVETAAQLVEPLREGLELLESDPERFKVFNPSNGWGDYEGLVQFVRNYLEACEQYPEAKVSVCR